MSQHQGDKLQSVFVRECLCNNTILLLDNAGDNSSNQRLIISPGWLELMKIILPFSFCGIDKLHVFFTVSPILSAICTSCKPRPGSAQQIGTGARRRTATHFATYLIKLASNQVYFIFLPLLRIVSAALHHTPDPSCSLASMSNAGMKLCTCRSAGFSCPSISCILKQESPVRRQQTCRQGMISPGQPMGDE